MWTNRKTGKPFIDDLNDEEDKISNYLDQVNYNDILPEECKVIIKGLDCLKKAGTYFQSVLESQEKRSEGE